MKNPIPSPRFLHAYCVAALLVPNIALCFTERMPLLACLAGILLPLGAYSLAMSLSRKTGRTVWILFPIVFFAAFQMVLVYLFGGGVIAVDMFLNLVTTNPGEAMELLDNLVPAVAGVFILYLPLLAIAAWQWARHITMPRQQMLRLRRLSSVLTGAGVLAVLLCYVVSPKASDERKTHSYSIADDLYPVNVFYNLALAINESRLSATYRERVADFTFGARPTHDRDSAEVYVLVIGETSRSRNWQLYGYPRPTNPELSRTDGLLVFRNVTSQSNTTHKSVPMLLTAADAACHDRLYHEKGIIAAFREAGFHTVFVSNQLRNHSYIDFLGEEADTAVFIRETAAARHDTTFSDERLLPYMKKVLAEGHRKLFIVLHTYGSHFNYRDRYPRSRARFLPDAPTDAKPENRPFLINAYDNTIVQTDHILASVIAMLGRQHCAAAMLYTSDHGENIFDDARRLFLHASPRPSAYDTDVPLIAWTSPEYARRHPSVVKAMQGNTAKGVQSSASIFPTMLSIAGIRTKACADSLSLTSPSYRLGTRLYLNDHNEAVMLEEGWD